MENGKMWACGDAACSLGLGVRDKIRISVRDRVGVRVSTFYRSVYFMPWHHDNALSRRQDNAVMVWESRDNGRRDG